MELLGRMFRAIRMSLEGSSLIGAGSFVTYLHRNTVVEKPLKKQQSLRITQIDMN